MRKFDAFTFVPGAICSLWASRAAKKEDAKEGCRKVEGRRAGRGTQPIARLPKGEARGRPWQRAGKSLRGLQACERALGGLRGNLEGVLAGALGGGLGGDWEALGGGLGGTWARPGGGLEGGSGRGREEARGGA